MIVKGVVADVQSDVGKALSKGVENLHFVVTGQICFLLHQDPGHLGVFRLNMLILNRSVFVVVGHSCLAFLDTGGH